MKVMKVIKVKPEAPVIKKKDKYKIAEIDMITKDKNPMLVGLIEENRTLSVVVNEKATNEEITKIINKVEAIKEDHLTT